MPSAGARLRSASTSTTVPSGPINAQLKTLASLTFSRGTRLLHLLGLAFVEAEAKADR
jgi:hypothetical protein